MKRVLISLVVVACFFGVVGCSSPTGDDTAGDQPIFLCDPTISIDYASGVPGTSITFPVNVDTNVYSLYEDLIDEVNLTFGYVIDAEVWNVTTGSGVDWQLGWGASVGTNIEEVGTPFASYNAELHPDDTGISLGDTILITIRASVTVTYDTSSQTYSLFDTFTHTF